MKANMGSTDRIVRLVITIVLVALVSAEVFSGLLAVSAIVLACVLVLTSLVGVCPLYKLFRFTTFGSKKTPAP